MLTLILLNEKLTVEKVKECSMLTKNKQEKSFYTFFFSVDKVSKFPGFLLSQSLMQNHICNKLGYFGKR